jgi:eukaryotic-like serine/threonine-protein kinase
MIPPMRDPDVDSVAGAERTEELPQPVAGETATRSEVPASVAQRGARPELSRGTSVGRYVVLDSIGSGGMGLVYLAIDPDLDRKIAIKLMRRRTPQGHARLLREGQAMARVKHPNVVSVHDLGLYEDLVFVAMDYIDGSTLTEHLAGRSHRWRDVMRVFLDAGEGLAAAHAAGVVHRDFKPDNVLVDKSGRVYVTDFGLARAALSPSEEDEEGEERSVSPPSGPLGTPVTRADTILGTPGYMAPEQLAGKPADERADQYAFCTSLHQALAKATPPPSRLRRIVQRGLSDDPAARYPSMRALLTALRATVARRRLIWIGAAALVLVAAVPAMVLASRSSRQAAPQPCRRADARLAGIWDAEVRARAESAFAATKVPYAAGIFSASAPLLDAYARDWVDMHTEACEATRVHGDQSDEALSLRMVCLDQRLRELDALSRLYAAADAKTVERAAQAASALTPLSVCADLQALRGPLLPPAQPPEAELEQLRTELARAKVLRDAGRFAEGLPVATSAVEHARALRYRALEAEALLARGHLEVAMGKAKEAEESLRQAVYAAEASRHDEVAGFAALRLAYVIGFAQSRPAEAAPWVDLAAAIEERAGGEERLACERLSVVGMLASRQGRYAESVDQLERALALCEKVYGTDHLFLWRRHSDLGASYIEFGQSAKAVVQYDQALAIQRKHQGADHPDVAIVLGNQAIAFARLGDDARALELLEQVVAIREQHFGHETPLLVAPLNNLASSLIDTGALVRALPVARRAVELASKTLGEKHLTTAIALVTLGSALVEVAGGDDAEAELGEAERRLDQALAVAASAEGGEHAVVADACEGLARLRWRQHRPRDVLALAERALAVREKAQRADAPELGEPLTLLGRARIALGRRAEAVEPLQRALAIREKSGARRRALDETRQALSEALRGRGAP